MGQLRVFHPSVFQKILPNRLSNSLSASSPEAKERQITGRLAIYESDDRPPKISEITADSGRAFINLLTSQVLRSVKERGSLLPHSAIRQVMENLVHADFRGVVVSIYKGGRVVRVTDQGPGITHVDKVFEIGFTTADPIQNDLVKGVGAGLPTVRKTMDGLGGNITIEPNLGGGTVVTMEVPAALEPSAEDEGAGLGRPGETPDFDLSVRQKKVLFLVTEIGTVGPSAIAAELGVSLSTAFRDLSLLEECRLVTSNEEGRRSLTQEGLNYLDIILNS